MRVLWKAITCVTTVTVCLLIALLTMKVFYDAKKDVLGNVIEDNTKRNVKELAQMGRHLKCGFGFDFLQDLSKLSDTKELRHILPTNIKQNLSGALVTHNLMCLDTMDSAENQWLGIFACHGQGRNQAITFTTDGFLQTSGKKPLCVSLKNMISKNVILKECNALDETQLWTTDSTMGRVKPITRQSHCLSAPIDINDAIDIELCSDGTNLQKWQLVMQDVLSIIMSDLSKNDLKLKRKGTSRQLQKILLQKPTEKMLMLNDILFSEISF